MQNLLFSRICLKVVGRQFRRAHTLNVGDHVTVKRKITKEDVDQFIKLTGDSNPIHITNEKPLVHGAFLNGLVSGVIGTKLPGSGTIVVKQTLKFPQPCYVGDEVLIFVELKFMRKLYVVEYQISAIESDRKRLVLKGEATLFPPQKDST